MGEFQGLWYHNLFKNILFIIFKRKEIKRRKNRKNKTEKETRKKNRKRNPKKKSKKESKRKKDLNID